MYVEVPWYEPEFGTAPKIPEGYKTGRIQEVRIVTRKPRLLLRKFPKPQRGEFAVSGKHQPIVQRRQMHVPAVIPWSDTKRDAPTNTRDTDQDHSAGKIGGLLKLCCARLDIRV